MYHQWDSCIQFPKLWCHNNDLNIHFGFLFSNFEKSFTKLKSWIHNGKTSTSIFALLLCSRNFFSFSKHFRSPPRSPQVISSRLQIIAKPFCKTTVGCIFYYSCTGDCCNNIVQKNRPEAGIFFGGKNDEVQHIFFPGLYEAKGPPKNIAGVFATKRSIQAVNTAPNPTKPNPRRRCS